jgi:hypothetical protein
VNVGDRIILEGISGTVLDVREETYVVEWSDGEVMGYFKDVSWEDADDFVRIDVGTEQFLDDLYEKNKGELPWNDAS